MHKSQRPKEATVAVEPTNQPSRFALFMASASGRALRIAMGLTLLTAGVLTGPPVGLLLAAFAVLPLASGTFNLCPIAPLWGGHFLGSRYCAAKPPAGHQSSK